MSAPQTADLQGGRYPDPRPVVASQRRPQPASVRPIFPALLGAVALLIGLLGCATFQGQTPEQRLFEAKTQYATVLSVAVAYAESPSADPDVVRVLISANRQAQGLLTQAELLLRAPPSAERDTAMDSTARLLVQITAALRQYLVEAAGEGG